MTEQPHRPDFHKLANICVEAESLHCEAFLRALFNITEEEHRQAQKWMTKELMGANPGPMPPSMVRTSKGHLPDDRMLSLAKEYRMYANEFRAGLLQKIYAAAIRAE